MLKYFFGKKIVMLTGMGHVIEAVNRSRTSQTVRVRGCSTSSASAVAASDLHQVCNTVLIAQTKHL